MYYIGTFSIFRIYFSHRLVKEKKSLELVLAFNKQKYWIYLDNISTFIFIYFISPQLIFYNKNGILQCSKILIVNFYMKNEFDLNVDKKLHFLQMISAKSTSFQNNNLLLAKL